MEKYDYIPTRILTGKQKKWDLKFLGWCEKFAESSRDPSTKVGACIVDVWNRVVSLGWNGFAQKCSDNEEYYNDRTVKYQRVVHGEVNALIFSKRDLTNCTLYTTPFPPCSTCTAIMIQAGITRFVSWDNDMENPRWKDSFDEAKRMCHEANIIVDLYHKD